MSTEVAIMGIARDPKICLGVAISMSPEAISKFRPSVRTQILRILKNNSAITVTAKTRTSADNILKNRVGHALVSLYFGDSSEEVLAVLSRGYDTSAKCGCGTLITKCDGCGERKWPWQLEHVYVLHPCFPRWWNECGCGDRYRYACRECNERCRAAGGREATCR